MTMKNAETHPKTHTDEKYSASNTKPIKGLSKKQSQWAWFLGLYLAGFLTVFIIAKLIKWAMGI